MSGERLQDHWSSGSVNGMMILVLAYKNGFKSKSVYYGL